MSDDADVRRAVDLLRAGELVAFPTETVYGLGADAANPDAVAKIFAAKGRPADHPLIVHVAEASQLDQWARDVPTAARELAAAFWPGPLTLILKRQPTVPDAVTGGQDTVGLRVPGHPLALALLQKFGGGIAAPSANRFGRISPTIAQHVREELGSAVALILDGGPCRVGIESTIVDLSREHPVVLRPGAITPAAIGAVLLAPVADNIAHDSPRVSGSLAAHYAPITPMRFSSSEKIANDINAMLQSGMKIAVFSTQTCNVSDERLSWLQAPAGAAAYAHDLYANLRKLDGLGVDLILVEAPPRSAEWRAVNDRLSRAEQGAGY